MKNAKHIQEEKRVIPSRADGEGISHLVKRFRVTFGADRKSCAMLSRDCNLQMRGPSPSARLGMTN
jgi:hypothetical protein